MPYFLYAKDSPIHFDLTVVYLKFSPKTLSLPRCRSSFLKKENLFSRLFAKFLPKILKKKVLSKHFVLSYRKGSKSPLYLHI